MSRLIRLMLSLAMVGCAQHVTPFAAPDAQPAMVNAEANAEKPADSVVAYVQYKNEDLQPSIFAVQWSYASNPFWHLEVEKCVGSGDEFDAQVVYNHIERGPQIKFDAIRTCDAFGKIPRTVKFYGIKFDPNAHFHVKFVDNKKGGRSLCASGGGNDEVCHTL